MNAQASPEVNKLLEQHDALLACSRHADAQALLQDALVSCYETSPISMDVALILDALALGCKELEQFREAAMYLAQSLAIKKLFFGNCHEEILLALRRLLFALPEEQALPLHNQTRAMARALGIVDPWEKFLLGASDLEFLEKYASCPAIDEKV